MTIDKHVFEVVPGATGSGFVAYCCCGWRCGATTAETARTFAVAHLRENGVEYYEQKMSPEGASCDFCMSPDVHWMYRARDFRQDRDLRFTAHLQPRNELRFGHMNVTHDSHGAWAACNVCYRLIARGDRERLCKRSAKANQRRRPERPVVSIRDLVKLIRPLHDEFWANREGQPVYFEERPRAEPA